MRGRPNNNGGGGQRKGPNPLTRSYESNGPDVKIRGNAHHVAEKYLQLARDAQSSGDPVAAESYLQHAEHYFRLIASAQAAQAGFSRQPDAVDTEGEDEDDSGLPDRFASPQAAVPFVPTPQPYVAERQPYSNGERQSYGDRQAAGGGERPSYGDRPANAERPPYGDRNSYQQRQDRSGMNRRPYRDNAAAGEIRTDDRQDRQGQDRQAQDRQAQDRQAQDRPYQDRGNGQDRSYQDRPDRQSRRERFAQERNGQAYDRQSGERYRDPAPAEAVRDPYAGEQPRIEPVVDRQLDYAPRPDSEQPPTVASTPQARDMPVEAPVPSVTREGAPRREPRQERAPVPTSEDAPGLPSFITTPTRVTPAAAAEPRLATATAFQGEGAEEAPKFPRRRRRTTRATTEAGDGLEGAAEQPVNTGE